MNMAIFAVWTLFVLVPQFVLEPSIQKQYLPCVHRNDSYKCSHNTTVHLVLANCTSPLRGSTTATFCTDQTSTVTTVPKGTKNSSNCELEQGEWYQCPAYKPSYDNPVYWVTGRGGYNETALFLGHYSNLTQYNGISYNRPVAILVCTGVVYTISFIMLIIRYALSLLMHV